MVNAKLGPGNARVVFRSASLAILIFPCPAPLAFQHADTLHYCYRALTPSTRRQSALTMSFLRRYEPDRVCLDVDGQPIDLIFYTALPSREDWEAHRRSGRDEPTTFLFIPFNVAAFKDEFIPLPGVVAVGFDAYLYRETTQETISSNSYNGRRKQKIREATGVANLVWDVKFGRRRKGREDFATRFRDALKSSRCRKDRRSPGVGDGSLPENEDDRGSSDEAQEQEEDFQSAVGDPMSSNDDAGSFDIGDTVGIEDKVRTMGFASESASDRNLTDEDRSTSIELEPDGNGAGSMEVADEVDVPQAIETGDEMAVDEPDVPEILAEGWDEYEALIRGGRMRKTKANPNDRRSLNGVLYQRHTRCEWRQLPERYGNWNTVHRRFKRWQQDGIWGKIEDLLETRGLIEASQRIAPSTIGRSSENPEERPEAATALSRDHLAALFADGKLFGDGDTSDGATKLLALLAEALEKRSRG